MDKNQISLDLGLPNLTIAKAQAKLSSVIAGYKKIGVSISGGADSDVILDMVTRAEGSLFKDFHFTFFNTGIEWQASRKHIEYLENKYCVEIKVVKTDWPVPRSVAHKGEPFINKHVSEMMERLQRHKFKWEDKPYEELIKEYPKCMSAIKWWCNWYDSAIDGELYNIRRNKLLKEFIVANPPKFSISNFCCKGAKKDVAKHYAKDNDIELYIIGVRSSEGGVRLRYKTCHYTRENSYDTHFPILYFKDNDKLEYENEFNVVHSKCYTEYGLKRTGCVGCPFGQWEHEINLAEKYEPNMHKAITYMFRNTYAYARAYRKFKGGYT